MTTLPPILNAPQVGMLIRRYQRGGWLIVRTNPRVMCYDERNGDTDPWAFGPGDELKWPNEPDTAWRNVFAEVKAEPVREWANLYLMSNGEVRTADWHNSPGDAENYRDNGSRFLAVICRERQPDGTWCAVTSEPTLERRPEGV